MSDVTCFLHFLSRQQGKGLRDFFHDGRMMLDVVAHVWNAIGYAVLFTVPMLIISPELRKIVKTYLISTMTDAESPPPKPSKEVTTGTSKSTVVAKPAAVKLAAKKQTESEHDENQEVTTELSKAQAVALELRRRIETGEELDPEFCAECAQVLDIDDETMASAFGVVKGAVKADAKKSASQKGLGSQKGSYEYDDDTFVVDRTYPTPSQSSGSGSHNVLATDWVKDLMPEGQESAVFSNIEESEKLIDSEGNIVDFSDFEPLHIEEIIEVFKSEKCNDEEKKKALIKLSSIVETTDSSFGLGRRETHNNQVRLLNVIIKHDGLAAIHAIQSRFVDKKYRVLAAHVLAKIASKIYEGWN